MRKELERLMDVLWGLSTELDLIREPEIAEKVRDVHRWITERESIREKTDAELMEDPQYQAILAGFESDPQVASSARELALHVYRNIREADREAAERRKRERDEDTQ